MQHILGRFVSLRTQLGCFSANRLELSRNVATVVSSSIQTLIGLNLCGTIGVSPVLHDLGSSFPILYIISYMSRIVLLVSRIQLKRHIFHHLHCAFSSDREDNITQSLGDEASLAVSEVILPLSAEEVDVFFVHAFVLFQ